MKGSAERPATELMLTTRPRAGLRSGRNAWVTATAPTTFTSSTRRSSSSGSSSSGPAAGIPALFTRPSSGAPASARSTSARARAMLPVSVTSMRSGVTPTRSSASASSGRRIVPNTRKPRPARWRALHAPIPVEAPVTTTPELTPRIYDLRASAAARTRKLASMSASDTGAGTANRAPATAARARLRILVCMATSGCRLPLRCRRGAEGLRRRQPVHRAVGSEQVQLPTRVLAERQHVAEARAQGPAGPLRHGAAGVGEAADPARAVVGVEILAGERGGASTVVDEPADDRATVRVVIFECGQDETEASGVGGARVRVVAMGALHEAPAIVHAAPGPGLDIHFFPCVLSHVRDEE